MRQVTKEQFFAVMNPLDVHPRVDATTLRHRWHVSHWEIQSTRNVIGISKSDSHAIEDAEYFLT
jgi:hypothetical protein